MKNRYSHKAIYVFLIIILGVIAFFLFAPLSKEKENVYLYIDEDDTLRKAITSPDWTKEFSSKDIDVAGFVRDMEDLVNGRKKKWICPFCGGHIVVLGKDGDENHIGCDSCDMRIDLSATLM